MHALLSGYLIGIECKYYKMYDLSVVYNIVNYEHATVEITKAIVQKPQVC